MEIRKFIYKNNQGEIRDLSIIDNLIWCNNSSLVEIISIPKEVTRLRCYDNKITKLPEILPNELQSLWLENNELTSLPKLPNDLKFLSCHYNKINQLPNLKECEQLNEIRCDINCFEYYMLEMNNVHFIFYC